MRPVKAAKLNPHLPFGMATIYSYPDDAGLDLMLVGNFVTIEPGELVQLPTNVAVSIPVGHFGFIYPRSSFIVDYNGDLQVLASPIDAGYIGELRILVRNVGRKPNVLSQGARVASLVLIPFTQANIELVPYEQLPQSARGTNGFGSSGR